MNVVLIEADQLSAKWLGCYGCDAAHTPNLDRLAAAGTLFTNAFSNMPVCMPNRASTITGRSAQHHGLFYNSWELGLDLPTFPQVLQEAGVQTFGVGKFHLECHGRSAHNDVLKYGFDRAEVTEDIRAGDWLDWVETEHPDHYETALTTVWPMPCLESYGSSGRNLRQEVLEARRRRAAVGPGGGPAPTPLPEAVCQTTWIVDRSIAFLREREPERPFFLKTSFVDPHGPYDPPERFLDLIPDDELPAPVQVEDPSLQTVLSRFYSNRFAQRYEGIGNEQVHAIRRHYFASVAFMDEQIGRLLEELEALGLAGNTAVLLTADHGDMLGDHGMPTKGSWHLDACMRVPLIARVPGAEAGRRCDRVVTNLDLFPTVTALAGVDHDVPLEGESLLPLVEGTAGLDRLDAALIETYGAYQSLGPAFRARSAVTPDARLTVFGDGCGMLFDMHTDPDETRNLYGLPEARPLRTRMQETMLQLWDRQYADLPTHRRNPCASH